MPRIGIDFDNTMVCYDQVFHCVAQELRLIPGSVAANKNAVRDHLRAQGGEEDWIALQGEVYGRRMLEAQPFPGLMRFLLQSQKRGFDLFVVSHKTRHPFKGPQWDLHQAAREWLEKHIPQSVIPGANIHFELTKDAKIQRIAQCGCTAFIDDLPEILTAPGFPETSAALLFDPSGHFAQKAGYARFASWGELSRYFDLAPVTI